MEIVNAGRCGVLLRRLCRLNDGAAYSSSIIVNEDWKLYELFCAYIHAQFSRNQ